MKTVGETSLLRFLVQSAEDLNSSLKLDDVFGKIAERVQSLVDCHLFCIMLWNDETRLLEHSFSLCYGEHVPQKGGFPLGHGIGGTAAAQCKPLRVPNVLVNPHYVRHRHPEVEIHSELAVPLIFKDRLIGVIDLESVEYDAFSEEHEQMVMALASHIAIALENARLFERVLADELRLEHELDTAREMQKQLLPEAGPRLERLDIGSAYLPVRTLGGDFYDFLRYGDGKWAIVAGDVAGKGTPAALYGSLAVGILRGHVVERPSGPAQMLELLNEELRGPGADNRFVAMAYAVFDDRTGTLDLANGGFPQPILLRDGKAERLDIRGLPLGLIPEARYEELRVELRPRDVLALCSDGLQESVNSQGEQFGVRGLGEVLADLSRAPAQQIADGVLRAGTAYAGEHEEHPDDRSVVVLKAR